MNNCGPKPPQYLFDSFKIRAILKERGPMSWHELLTRACAEGVDVTADFDSAVISALNVGFVKARFEVCTPEEEKAFQERGARPVVETNDMQTAESRVTKFKDSDGREWFRVQTDFPDQQNTVWIHTGGKKQ